jgi:uncharacterized protein (TIGR00725 family)
MSHRNLVAVVGDGAASQSSDAFRLAEDLGKRLVDAGFLIVTGGLGGVMEAACRGARGSAAYRRGDTLGILPGDDPGDANPFVDVAIPTGLGHVRNVLVARADAVVAVGGGAGTLSEMALAWVLRRLVVALAAEGWSARLAGAPVDPRPRFPEMPGDRVFAAATPEDAVAIVVARLPGYLRARRTG